jgi:hypothetical protein
MTGNCSGCVFAEVQIRTEIFSDDERREREIRFCHRFPPTPIRQPDYDGHGGLSVWPMVRATDGCGEFSQA